MQTDQKTIEIDLNQSNTHQRLDVSRFTTFSAIMRLSGDPTGATLTIKRSKVRDGKTAGFSVAVTPTLAEGTIVDIDCTDEAELEFVVDPPADAAGAHAVLECFLNDAGA